LNTQEDKKEAQDIIQVKPKKMNMKKEHRRGAMSIGGFSGGN
jgi:hypothetical protein